MRLSSIPVLRAAATAGVAAMLIAPAMSAQQKAYTAVDYARAERLLGQTVNPLVFGSSIRPVWLANDRLWYRVSTPNGSEFILVDPAKGTRTRAFDNAKMAAGLSAASGQTVGANALPFNTIEFTPTGAVLVHVGTRRYE